MTSKASLPVRRTALILPVGTGSRAVFVSAALFGAGLAWSAAAQSLTTPVERAVAGQTVILERFTSPPQAGRFDLTVVDQRKQIDMDAAAKVRFRLRSLSIDGARTVPPADLARLWQGRIGTDVTLADLYRIADAVDAAYYAAGYFSKTVVPEQNLATGEISLRVYEGYVQRVEITSDIPGIETRLAPYIDRILRMSPIRVKEAERILLLMSDIGGLDIEGTFVRPEEATGGGLLKLEIGQTRRSGVIGLDNMGSDSVGPLELSANLMLNDVFRRFETTSLVGVTIPDNPKELGMLQIGQDYPVGADGVTMGYSLSYVRSRPGGSEADNDIDVTSVVGGGYLAYPFLRTEDHSIYGRAELFARHDTVDAAGTTVSDARTQWGEFTLQYDRAFETGGFSIDGGFSLGSASDDVTGDAREDFHLFTTGFNYAQALGDVADLGISGIGQFATESLPGAVRFAVGGAPYGWAFDNGSISGDSGMAAAVEIGRDLETGMGFLPGLSVAAFVDYGTVWNHGDQAGSRDSLGSYGLQLSGMMGERVAFQLIASRPWTTPELFEDPDRRLLFRLSVPL
ncbi:ShlB/FhaC/HecB family hemolysin secretion/activation protein [Chachezhania antarctica]|mgnify:CR=1 FL=1|uniref:ShlB/FhaC/HecB family hemolysin secretion/activation protein n=1 Tax=Chachezhania antarctica TaxID=2340860 RepID=UPI0013CEB03B|nr:ShlB/FhaC/HecB family hemolysin secretion/activation protein [Chachezhania antarctica]